MSSARFEAELIPDKRVRRALACFACAATLAGGLLIAIMPLALPVRVLFGALWLASGTLELRAMVLGMARLDGIRISADGQACGLSGGGVEPLELLPGSVVLARVAWLRIRFADGLRYGELLMGNPRRCRDWRCLQLAWRQQPFVFGRPEGS